MNKLYALIISKLYMTKYLKDCNAHWLYLAPKFISYPMWHLAQRWHWFGEKMKIAIK